MDDSSLRGIFRGDADSIADQLGVHIARLVLTGHPARELLVIVEPRDDGYVATCDWRSWLLEFLDTMNPTETKRLLPQITPRAEQVPVIAVASLYAGPWQLQWAWPVPEGPIFPAPGGSA